jgi:diaminopimelate epimerase
MRSAGSRALSRSIGLVLPLTGLRFAKGHGTGNDFVVLPDPDGEIDLTPALVRAICDRRQGMGADGVLRVVLSAAIPEGRTVADQARWFMDYRNADGSLAEMCGNGVRVYARYLVEEGYAQPGCHLFGTRAGVRAVTVPADGDVTVDMGYPRPLDIAGLTVTVGSRTWPGAAISMGNPHVVVAVDDLEQPGALSERPSVRPGEAFPGGENVEFVVVAGDQALAMRVHERGVGETSSCGTGACAAVAAVRAARRDSGPAVWTVDVPGGRLRVEIKPSGNSRLSGPAELVAEGELRPAWLASAGAAG